MKSKLFTRTLLLSAAIGSVSLMGVLADAPAQPPIKAGGMFGDNKTQYTAPDPIAEQRKVVVAAGKESKKSEAAFNAIVTKLKKEYESSDDYKKLLADIKTAQDAYQAAIDPINAGLKKNADYSAALAAHDTAQKNLDEMAKKPNASFEDRKSASDSLKEADDKIATIQSAAYDADPNVKDLKAKVDEATKAARTAKREYETTGIKENSDWVKAKEDMETAKSNLLAASQTLKDLINPPPASQPAINSEDPLKGTTTQGPPKTSKEDKNKGIKLKNGKMYYPNGNPGK